MSRHCRCYDGNAFFICGAVVAGATHLSNAGLSFLRSNAPRLKVATVIQGVEKVGLFGVRFKEYDLWYDDCNLFCKRIKYKINRGEV